MVDVVEDVPAFQRLWDFSTRLLFAAGRPPDWNRTALEDVFEPRADPQLRDRYRRWRALMAEATGI